MSGIAEGHIDVVLFVNFSKARLDFQAAYAGAECEKSEYRRVSADRK
jgi:hypothetical protein